MIQLGFLFYDRLEKQQMADGGVRDAEVFKAGASEKKDEGIYNGPGTCVRKTCS